MSIKLPTINEIEISGRIANDLELKYTASGKAVLRFSIAHTRQVKSDNGWDKETSFYRVVVWDKAAEQLSMSAIKGSPVLVKGRVEQSKYTNKEGIEVTSIEINAFTVHVLEWLEKDDQLSVPPVPPAQSPCNNNAPF